MQKFIFFTGKGGVGKTTLSCATAVKLVKEGQKVLLVCTDPASNLSDVLNAKVNPHITEHPNLKNLYSINIDPNFSVNEYRERIINMVTKKGDIDSLNKVKNSIHGACTIEIASFDHFSRFISGEMNDHNFNTIIFDTAPTGHTLRLLELPEAWETYLENNPRGGASIRPESNMHLYKDRYNKVVRALKNKNQTVFNLVSRPDKNSLKEAARTSVELTKMKYSNQQLYINGIFHPMDKKDKLASQIQRNSIENLKHIPNELINLNSYQIDLLPYNILGIELLESVYDMDVRKKVINRTNEKEIIKNLPLKNLHLLVDKIKNNNGLIMTMGKGGVGKTLVASYIALKLAKKGKKVTLTTTDPAAHLHNFLKHEEKLPDTLTIQKIDPKLETELYRQKTFEQKKVGLSEREKVLLWEDLQTPCNQEVSVFIAFSKMLRIAKKEIVVMDTAPTGHTLLLMDTTGTYHQEIIDSSNFNLNGVTTPYMQLQDPAFAKILLVSLPEKTPINEALQLKKDLQKVNIFPYSWIINQSFSDLSVTDPILSYKKFTENLLVENLKKNIEIPLFKINYIPNQDILKFI